jgi:hypothetical protein
MDKDEFGIAVVEMADLAWSTAYMFELIASAYSAILAGNYDLYQNALINLQRIPRENSFTVEAAKLHENICDLGWSTELSHVASDIHHALTAEKIGH